MKQLVFTLLAVLGAPIPQASAAERVVPADWFDCKTGAYRFSIADHYPSLFKIGQHKITELGQRTTTTAMASETIQLRRIEYIGMTLDVAVSSLNPERYVLQRAEVWSRRWNIGRLWVGRRPWQSDSEKSLAGVELNGLIELQGANDRAQLQMSDGRVVRVTFHCQGLQAK
jgi:hypothetical protein